MLKEKKTAICTHHCSLATHDDTSTNTPFRGRVNILLPQHLLSKHDTTETINASKR